MRPDEETKCCTRCVSFARHLTKIDNLLPMSEAQLREIFGVGATILHLPVDPMRKLANDLLYVSMQIDEMRGR